MPYAIKCVTEGEQRLAQDILFSKGYSWGWGRQRAQVRPEGQWLILREQSITFLWLGQWDERTREYTVINMSELLHV